ncbi:MAG: c-type cytochrome [Vicingaceae bacterium]
MKNLVLKIIIVSSVIFVSSCSYNKDLPEPEVITENEENVPVTYTDDVQAIMTNNCTGCHGGSGGVNLNTYAQVKAQADAGRLLARAINGAGGPMPQGGLMPQATRDVLQAWLDQGAPE